MILIDNCLLRKNCYKCQKIDMNSKYGIKLFKMKVINFDKWQVGELLQEAICSLCNLVKPNTFRGTEIKLSTIFSSYFIVITLIWEVGSLFNRA